MIKKKSLLENTSFVKECLTLHLTLHERQQQQQQKQEQSLFVLLLALLQGLIISYFMVHTFSFVIQQPLFNLHTS